MGIGFFKKNPETEKAKADAKAAAEQELQDKINAQQQSLSTATPDSAGASTALMSKVQGLLDAQRIKFEAQLLEKENALNEAMSEGTQLASQFETLQTQKAAADATITKLQTEKDQLQKSVNDSANSSSGLKQQLDAANASLAEVTKERDDLKSKLAQAESTSATKIKQLETERDLAVTQRDQEIERSSNLQDELNRFQSELDNITLD